MLTDRAQIEQIIFGHIAEDNKYAHQLEQQAKEFIPEVEEFTREFLDDLLRISRTVLQGLAIALGEEEDFFVKVITALQSALKFAHMQYVFGFKLV